ncbi:MULTISPECIES: hypothetical protein [Dickeya]|uniref:Uncharacterized protein n=1 Tax=Dickeya chrysanthemi TaxID=556 RepID=A0ABU8JQL4_DICCH|nr:MULTISPECIES: hypothetical protein [Dickeya]MBX9448167.1 hypothetical protein [Dickeya chrysanthemi]TYL40826.1 hypothetical protein FDP13_21095 [Dickeya sp. ws52]
MSYEYQLSSAIEPADLYKKVRSLIANSADYVTIFSDNNSAGFKNKNSESNWSSDIDLSFSSDCVFLEIHAGNAKVLLKYINDSLILSDVPLDIEEQ